MEQREQLPRESAAPTLRIKQPMVRVMLNRPRLLLIGAVGAVTILVLLWLSSRSTLPSEVMPNPNGYDDFVAAGESLGEGVTNWNRLTLDELRSLVTTNAGPLRRLRLGLTRECKVRPYSLSASDLGHVEVSRWLDLLGQVLAAEAGLALLEGRTNDAAAVCLDWTWYGQKRGRGGPITDDGCGFRIQTNALGVLGQLVDCVEPAMAQRVVTTLGIVISDSESAEDVLAQELDWLRRGRFGWFQRVMFQVDGGHSKLVKVNLQKRHAELDGSLRGTMAAFAERSQRDGPNK